MTDPSDRDPAQFPLLAALPPDLRHTIAASMRWTQYSEGQTILAQADASGDVYFLARGRLLAVNWTEDGREIIFTSLAEGSYFGELTALDGGPRSLCVYARTSSSLAVMPVDVFRGLIHDSPAFRDRVITDLVSRVRQLTERNCQLITYSVPDRVKAFILSRAAEQGQLTAGSVLTAFPTHAEIAAHIGANREAVSRTLSALAQDGTITARRGALTILAPDQLMISTAR